MKESRKGKREGGNKEGMIGSKGDEKKDEGGRRRWREREACSVLRLSTMTRTVALEKYFFLVVVH
jgi:hypothetical protein